MIRGGGGWGFKSTVTGHSHVLRLDDGIPADSDGWACAQ